MYTQEIEAGVLRGHEVVALVQVPDLSHILLLQSFSFIGRVISIAFIPETQVSFLALRP